MYPYRTVLRASGPNLDALVWPSNWQSTLRQRRINVTSGVGFPFFTSSLSTCRMDPAMISEMVSSGDSAAVGRRTFESHSAMSRSSSILLSRVPKRPS
jgi:hypothetical protein